MLWRAYDTTYCFSTDLIKFSIIESINNHSQLGDLLLAFAV